MAPELAQGGDTGGWGCQGLGLSRRSWPSPARGPARAQVPHRNSRGDPARPVASSQGLCPRPPRRARRSGAMRPRVRGAAGRVLPVDLEREGAALCARQRGHGPSAARQPLGERGADSGGPARHRASAAHAERDASLICQSPLETSAFPPSALKSPRGEGPTSELRRGVQPPAPGLARQEPRARRGWTHRGTALRMRRPKARFPGP